MRNTQIKRNRKKFFHRTQNQFGFTLAELLAVIAIIGIVAAFGFVNVVHHQRRLKLTEEDNIAREIFTASQNHMQSAVSDGSWIKQYADISVKDSDASSYYGDSMQLPDGVEKGDEYKESNHDWRRFVVNGSNVDSLMQNTALGTLLPQGSIDESVRNPGNGSIVIEYDALQGEMFGVFYSDSCSTFKADDVTTNFNSIDARSNESKRLQYTPVSGGNSKYAIGYYGVSVVNEGTEPENNKDDKPVQELKRVEINLVNESKLLLHVTNPNDPSTSTYTITLYDSNGHSLVLDTNEAGTSARLKPAATEKGNSTYILDSITDQGCHFSQLISETDFSLNTKLHAAITVSRKGTQSVSADSNAADSLFGDDSDGVNVSVDNVRHLENLSYTISGLSKETNIVSATVEKDLSWSGFWRDLEKEPGEHEKVYDSTGKALDKKYYGIKNSTLAQFTGKPSSESGASTGESGSNTGNNKVALTGFDIAPVEGSAGILADLSDDSSSSGSRKVIVSNFELKDTKVTDAGNVNAGALIGVTGNCSVTVTNIAISGNTAVSGTENVGAILGSQNDKAVDLKMTNCSVDGANITGGSKTAGGLVGAAFGKTLNIGGCTVKDTTVTSSDSVSAAGGLIGSAVTADTVKINKCSVEVSDNKNLSVSGATAGGFIGSINSAKASTIKECVVDGGKEGIVTASAASAGGFIGSTTGSGNLSVSDCYSSVLVKAQLNAGGFIGEAKGKLSINKSYSGGRTDKDQNYSDSDLNVASTAGEAGGFIGSVFSGANVSVQNSYSTSSAGSSDCAGGFIGNSSGTLTIFNSYSTGLVKAAEGKTGLFVGSGTISTDSTGNYCLDGVKGNTGIPVIGNAGDSAVTGISKAGTGNNSAPFSVATQAEAAAKPYNYTNNKYPFKTVEQLAGSTKAEGKHIGDWPKAEVSNPSGYAENGNTLTFHFALPKGTEYFTVAVEGLANIQRDNNVYYAPFHIKSDNSVEWITFFNSQWFSNWNESSFQSDSRKENCQLAKVETKEEYAKRTGQEASDDYTYVAVTLDDLSKAIRYKCGPFTSIFADMKLDPGEDIDVRINSGISKFDLNDVEGLISNSTYADGSNWTISNIEKDINGDGINEEYQANTAYIANSRHLLNLDSNISNVAFANESQCYKYAVQIDNIFWSNKENALAGTSSEYEAYILDLKYKNNTDSTGVYWWNSSNALTQNNSFWPINNTNLESYDGQNYALENITINTDNIVTNLRGQQGNPAIFCGVKNGFQISNLKIHNISVIDNRDYANISALISSGTDLQISNIRMSGNCTISTGSNTGTIAGGMFASLKGTSTINDCEIEGILNVEGNTAGGLIGNSSGNLTVNNIKITGSDTSINGRGTYGTTAGGFIANASNTSLRCSNVGVSVHVESENNGSYLGGFIGNLSNASGAISNCYAAGRTNNGKYVSTADYDYTANIKYSDSNLNPYNDSMYVGGFIGLLDSSSSLTITNSFSTVSVKTESIQYSTNNCTGGFIGSASGSGVTLQSCYSTGLVTMASGSGYTGGSFIGTASSGIKVSDCHVLDGINDASTPYIKLNYLYRDPDVTDLTDTSSSSTSITVPYDTSLNGLSYPYPNSTALKFDTDQEAISYYGDWPIVNINYDIGFIYYEIMADDQKTLHYNGYLASSSKRNSYIPVSSASNNGDSPLVTEKNKYVKQSGYLLLLKDDALKNLDITFGNVADERYQKSTGNGTIRPSYSIVSCSNKKFNKYFHSAIQQNLPQQFEDYTAFDISEKILDNRLFSQNNNPIDYQPAKEGVVLNLLSDNVQNNTIYNYERVASFGYLPFFADTITVPSDTQYRVPDSVAKKFITNESNVDAIYKIRSIDQWNALATSSNAMQYLWGISGKNIVIEQQMDISFNRAINGDRTVEFNPLDALGYYGSVTYYSAADINGNHFSLDSISASVVQTISTNGSVDSVLITNSTYQKSLDSIYGGKYGGDGIAYVNYGVVQNCILQNCSISGNGIAYINYGTIQNCNIQNCSIEGDGITFINYYNSNIKNNIVQNCTINGSGITSNNYGFIQ